MHKKEEILKHIFMVYMDREKKSYTNLTRIGEGNDHIVFSYISNGLKHVARMPKRRCVIAKIKREVPFLSRLKETCSNNINIIIPDLQLSASNYSFSTMPFLPGKSLDEIPNWNFSESNLETLASFLSEMHNSPKNNSKILQGLLPVNFKAGHIELVKDIFSVSEKKIINEMLFLYLKDSQGKNIAPLHFDLSPIHIFLDEDCAKIESIIDFSNCRKGDIHFDLYRIYQTLSSENTWNLFKSYYEKFTRFNVDEKKMFLLGFIQTLNEVASKVANADHPIRITGAKNRTLFLMDKYLNART